MISSHTTIINKLGLHARAASKLVTTTSQYSSNVTIEKNGQSINAKSIMGVMMLAASKGTDLILHIEGRDEKACTEAVLELINNKFDEAE